MSYMTIITNWWQRVAGYNGKFFKQEYIFLIHDILFLGLLWPIH